jgi:WD40 repeat protein
LLRTLNGHTDWVRALTVLQNGDLASGSDDKTIKIWNPIDGTLKRTLTGHTNSVLALTVLQNGDLASGSSDTTIKIWSK